MTTTKPRVFGPMTLSEWDLKWKPLEGGLKADHDELKGKIGLFRMRINGCDMAIGKAVEKKGGLKKRLSDFSRFSPSGRDYKTGKKIHDNIDVIDVEVLITSGLKSNARTLADDLRGPMIDLHQPEWTVRARYRKRKPKSAGLATKPAPYTGTIPKG